MRLTAIFAAAFVIALSGSNPSKAAGTGQCTCATTIVGSGSSREIKCEGFEPATHQRCQCEKVMTGDQPSCRPKQAFGSHVPSPQPPSGSPGHG